MIDECRIEELRSDSMKRPRIVMCTGYYLPHVGGIERYVYHISQHLLKRGWEVCVLTSQQDGLPDIETIHGIKVFRLPSVLLANGRMPLPKMWKKATRELICQLKEWKPDVFIVHTYLFPICILAAIIGRKLQLPVIVIGHGSGHVTSGTLIVDWALHIYEHFMAKALALNSLKFFAVSRKAESWWHHFGIETSGVIYNGIEVENLPPIRSDFLDKLGIDNESIVISYAARLMPGKGADVIARVFYRIQKDYPGVYLVIAGDGPAYDAIAFAVKGNERIHLLGEVSHEEVMCLFGVSDIFAYPSQYPEGLPTCLLEAGAMQCALIATPAGGTEELICNPEHGRIVRSDEELEAALRALLGDSNLRQKLASNIQKRIHTYFDWAVIEPLLAQEILSALQSRRKNP